MRHDESSFILDDLLRVAAAVPGKVDPCALDDLSLFVTTAGDVVAANAGAKDATRRAPNTDPSGAKGPQQAAASSASAVMLPVGIVDGGTTSASDVVAGLRTRLVANGAPCPRVAHERGGVARRMAMGASSVIPFHVLPPWESVRRGGGGNAAAWFEEEYALSREESLGGSGADSIVYASKSADGRTPPACIEGGLRRRKRARQPPPSHHPSVHHEGGEDEEDEEVEKDGAASCTSESGSHGNEGEPRGEVWRRRRPLSGAGGAATLRRLLLQSLSAATLRRLLLQSLSAAMSGSDVGEEEDDDKPRPRAKGCGNNARSSEHSDCRSLVVIVLHFNPFRDANAGGDRQATAGRRSTAADALEVGEQNDGGDGVGGHVGRHHGHDDSEEDEERAHGNASATTTYPTALADRSLEACVHEIRAIVEWQSAVGRCIAAAPPTTSATLSGAAERGGAATGEEEKEGAPPAAAPPPLPRVAVVIVAPSRTAAQLCDETIGAVARTASSGVVLVRQLLQLSASSCRYHSSSSSLRTHGHGGVHHYSHAAAASSLACPFFAAAVLDGFLFDALRRYPLMLSRVALRQIAQTWNAALAAHEQSAGYAALCEVAHLLHGYMTLSVEEGVASIGVPSGMPISTDNHNTSDRREEGGTKGGHLFSKFQYDVVQRCLSAAATDGTISMSSSEANVNSIIALSSAPPQHEDNRTDGGGSRTANKRLVAPPQQDDGRCIETGKGRGEEEVAAAPYCLLPAWPTTTTMTVEGGDDGPAVMRRRRHPLSYNEVASAFMRHYSSVLKALWQWQRRPAGAEAGSVLPGASTGGGGTQPPPRGAASSLPQRALAGKRTAAGDLRPPLRWPNSSDGVAEWVERALHSASMRTLAAVSASGGAARSQAPPSGPRGPSAPPTYDVLHLTCPTAAMTTSTTMPSDAKGNPCGGAADTRHAGGVPLSATLTTFHPVYGDALRQPIASRPLSVVGGRRGVARPPTGIAASFAASPSVQLANLLLVPSADDIRGVPISAVGAASAPSHNDASEMMTRAVDPGLSHAASLLLRSVASAVSQLLPMSNRSSTGGFRDEASPAMGREAPCQLLDPTSTWVRCDEVARSLGVAEHSLAFLVPLFELRATGLITVNVAKRALRITS